MRDLTQGRPIRVILAFFVPVLMGNLFQQFYNMADTAIVGKFLGKEALAAVGSVGSLNFLVLGFVWGFCGGLCIPIARSFGAKDMRSMRVYLAHAVYLSAALIILLTSLTVCMSGLILRMMNTPDDMFPHAYAYITTIFAGIGAVIIYNILAGVARAVGDSRTPLYFLILASILNIGLDLLFILVFHWGTFGAAFATVLAQGLAAAACFVYMKFKIPELKVNKGEWKPNRQIFLEMLRVSIPMALQFSITAIGGIILQACVNPLGSTVVATVTAAGKAQFLIALPLESMGITMATYASQNLGAQRLDRVRSGVKSALILTFLFSICCFVLNITVGPSISRLFLDEASTQIMADISQFLFRNGAFYWALGILFVLRNVIQGLGFAVPSVAAGIFELAGRALVGIFLVPIFGFTAICFANSAAWFSAVLLLIPVYIYVIRTLQNSPPNTKPAIRAPSSASDA